MFIMPAVDIKNGKCVQLVQGKPGTEQIVLENPAEVAKGWENRGASVLHVIDLGGALEEGGNIPVVEDILKKVSIPVQMGGGIRSIDDAAHLLNMGVDRVILGTLAIQEPETVETLSQEFGSQRIMVALDSKDSQVVVRGWTEKTNQTAPELGKTMEEKGAIPGGPAKLNLRLWPINCRTHRFAQVLLFCGFGRRFKTTCLGHHPFRRRGQNRLWGFDITNA